MRRSVAIDGRRANAGEVIAALAAAPRPAGGAAEAAARAECARRLVECGFRVTEEAFHYSALPGRWATSLGGVGAAVLLAGAGHVGYRGRPGQSLGIIVGGGLAVAALGGWVARRGVLALPLMRRRGVNLTAVRGVNEPAVWLVAHLDSKSQPVPIGVRAAGVAGVLAAGAAAVAVAVAQLLGVHRSAGWWPAVSALGALAAVPVALSVVGDESPGALDNASGVAAVLRTAAGLPNDTPVGIVLTSAEELGLAGARAWARGRLAATALNFDGIDDDGTVTAMYSGARPAALIRVVGNAARGVGEPVRTRRLVPGILTDGVALADRGWAVLTLSRGTVRTLARIHRPGDVAERLTGSGVERVAAVAIAAVGELTRAREA